MKTRACSTKGWISVRNWRRFQHYDPTKRVPPWIKNNTDLMANDSYLSLTEHRALMLHRLWLEYASSRCELSDDTLRLSRRLGMKVTRADLEALNRAGWIDIVASKALADGYQDASARAHDVEVETEKEKEPRPLRVPTTPPPNQPNGPGLEDEQTTNHDHDHDQLDRLHAKLAQATTAITSPFVGHPREKSPQ